MVLQLMRKRESEVDGQMSCLRGVEYDGGRKGRDGKEAGVGFCGFCARIRA